MTKRICQRTSVVISDRWSPLVVLTLAVVPLSAPQSYAEDNDKRKVADVIELRPAEFFPKGYEHLQFHLGFVTARKFIATFPKGEIAPMTFDIEHYVRGKKVKVVKSQPLLAQQSTDISFSLESRGVNDYLVRLSQKGVGWKLGPLDYPIENWSKLAIARQYTLDEATRLKRGASTLLWCQFTEQKNVLPPDHTPLTEELLKECEAAIAFRLTLDVRFP